MISREVLGLIWAGHIQAWNDPAIVQLNPSLSSKLPAAPIVTGYVDVNGSVSAIEIVKLSLENFSDKFKAAFAAANRTFGLLPPAQRGFSIPVIDTTTTGRIRWLQVSTCPFIMLC